MWSGTNDSKLRRTVNGNARPNYLKYGDVFMTSPQPQQRRPINRSRSINKVDEEKIFQKNSFRSVTPEFEIDRFSNEPPFAQDENINFRNEAEFEPQSVDVEQFEDIRERGTIPDFCMNRSEFCCPQTEQLRVERSQRNSQQFGRVPELSSDVPTQRNVYFKKRQLPRLQRYNDGIPNEQEADNYWNDFDEYSAPKKKSKYTLLFPQLWQKFVITFTSLLSIICLTWIAYNWKTTNNENSIPEIKSEKSVFKVLPDAPGEADFVYQNKAVYDRVDPNIQVKRRDEHLMSPSEDPGELPMSNNFSNSNIDRRASVPSYTIIDDRDYYVKCKKNSDVLMARQQLTTIRKKLSSYSNPDVLSNVSCSIRKVANTQGQLGEYILIGPFIDEKTARNVGKFCQINNGEIISVQKKEHS